MRIDGSCTPKSWRDVIPTTGPTRSRAYLGTSRCQHCGRDPGCFTLFCDLPLCQDAEKKHRGSLAKIRNEKMSIDNLSRRDKKLAECGHTCIHCNRRFLTSKPTGDRNNLCSSTCASLYREKQLKEKT